VDSFVADGAGPDGVFDSHEADQFDSGARDVDLLAGCSKALCTLDDGCLEAVLVEQGGEGWAGDTGAGYEDSRLGALGGHYRSKCDVGGQLVGNSNIVCIIGKRGCICTFLGGWEFMVVG